MKRLGIVSLIGATLVFVALWIFTPSSRTGSEASGSMGEGPVQTVSLDVGLDDAGVAVWHHLDEGGGFLPLSFLSALTDTKTGVSFLEALPNYGFIADPSNELGVPIGLSVGHGSEGGGPVLIGVTCSACHSGQYTYQGTAITIDGAPNMVDLEALFRELSLSLEETLRNPRALLAFVRQVAELEHAPESDDELFELEPDALALLGSMVDASEAHPHALAGEHVASAIHDAYHATDRGAADDVIDTASESIPDAGEGGPDEGRLRSILRSVRDDLGVVKRRAERLSVLSQVFDHETEAGPGRADSFDVIWDLLVQQDAPIPMDAPVSIPHLFHYGEFRWVHWDGNTSTVLGRDYAQAIALGADYEPSTQQTSVLPRNVMALEAAAREFTAPVWPVEVLGPIDPELAAVGEQAFADSCARCHSQENVIPLDEIGTDAGRAQRFAELSWQGASYADVLKNLGDQVTAASFAAHGVTPAEVEATRRVQDPTWRITGGYQTRTLRGVWASAPFLHNGSVPTLWDLLQSPEARPAEFLVGREMDPHNVGVDAKNQPESLWVFRTSEVGNGNGGHVFGTDLPDETKRAIIEYLKTL